MRVDPTKLGQQLTEQTSGASLRQEKLQASFLKTDRWFKLLFDPKHFTRDLENMIYTMRNEVIAFGSLGFFRPCIYSLRSFYELSVSWLYYFEHPREWDSCTRGDQFFMTPGDVRKETAANFAYFEANFDALMPTKGWRNPYSELSKFVHSADPDIVPLVQKEVDLICGENEFSILLRLANESNACLFDWYAAVFAPEKMRVLPEQLIREIDERLPQDVRDGFWRGFLRPERPRQVKRM